MDISIIVPAYNEEYFIGHTIASIKQWVPQGLIYEVIVVDHGSTDQTINVATKSGEAIIIDGNKAKTIAALRNLGALYSTGEILFFIDADVTFSENWSKNIGEVIASIKEYPNKICGSHPIVPENSNALIKNWFNPKSTETSPNYIGACHLIISKIFFNKVNGFPEFMETSEEFTLCKNAKSHGGIIQAYPELTITHHGAPKTIIDFIKSEIWHGRGDWTSIASTLSSKTSLFTLLFITLHFFLFYYLSQKIVTESVLMILAITFICAASSFFKFLKHSFFYAAVNTITFYLYFLGRSISLLSAMVDKDFTKRSRSF